MLFCCQLFAILLCYIINSFRVTTRASGLNTLEKNNEFRSLKSKFYFDVIFWQFHIHPKTNSLHPLLNKE